MDFQWNDEQLSLRNTMVEFARDHLNDDLEDRERSGTFSRDLWQRCADFGVFGLPVPEEYGGSNQDVLTTTLVMEALGYGCRDQGLLFSIHAHMWAIIVPILRFAAAAVKSECIPRLVDGTWVGAHAMTEPGSGSDAFGLSTRAVRHGDMYLLTGSKTFVTNAPEADLFLVFATVNPGRGMWGVTAFLVKRDTPGLVIGNKLEKMGLTTSPMAEVFFEDCAIPVTARLGREGQGNAIFNHSMAWERSCILGSTVGAMQRQLETSVQYAQDRRQFGRSIGDFQLVAAKLAEMRVRLETARLLLYKAAWAQGQADGNALEGAIAKLFISEAAVESALDAIQIRGGYGYMKEYQVERELRDSIGARLYSGTSEIQRLIIARHLGLSPDR